MGFPKGSETLLWQNVGNYLIILLMISMNRQGYQLGIYQTLFPFATYFIVKKVKIHNFLDSWLKHFKNTIFQSKTIWIWEILHILEVNSITIQIINYYIIGGSLNQNGDLKGHIKWNLSKIYKPIILIQEFQKGNRGKYNQNIKTKREAKKMKRNTGNMYGS